MASTTPTLETARLILRPASLDDCAELQPLFADFEVVKYMVASIPWPQPADGVLTYTRIKALPEMEAGICYTWTIFNKPTNAAMGRISLQPTLEEGNREHRGYWLGRAFHQHGYMAEALAVTANYGFNTLAMPAITSSVGTNNIGSTKLQQRSGAVIIKEYESDYIIGREPAALWELTPEAWRTSSLKQKYG